jgi:hypothetical protein
MNNQMITHARPTTVPGAIDVWGNANGASQQLGAYQPQAPAGPSPTDKVQRLLRGRVALAIVLALLGGIIGGHRRGDAAEPQLQGDRQDPDQADIMLVEGDKQMPYYMQFMTTQALTLTSPDVVNNVPKHEPWKSQFGDNIEALIAFGSGLKAEYVRNSFNIDVSCIADDPKVATTGIQALIASYAENYKETSDDDLSKRISVLETESRNLQFKKDNAEKMINDLVGKYGAADLEPLVAYAQSYLDDVKRDLRVNQNNMNAATQASQAMRDSNGKIPIEELAQVDPEMFRIIGQLKEAQNNLATLERRLATSTRRSHAARQDVEHIVRQVEDYATVLRKDVIAIIPDFGRPNGVLKITQGQLKVMEHASPSARATATPPRRSGSPSRNDAGNVAVARTTSRTRPTNSPKRQRRSTAYASSRCQRQAAGHAERPVRRPAIEQEGSVRARRRPRRRGRGRRRAAGDRRPGRHPLPLQRRRGRQQHERHPAAGHPAEPARQAHRPGPSLGRRPLRPPDPHDAAAQRDARGLHGVCHHQRQQR